MSNFEFFSKDSSWLGEAYASIWGCLDICLTAKPVSFGLHNLFRALLPHQPEGLGQCKKFCSNIASTKDGPMSDRVYGLFTIWVNLYQARVSTVEEAVRQLTTLLSSGPNWPYTLVQLKGDTCHVSLPGRDT